MGHVIEPESGGYAEVDSGSGVNLITGVPAGDEIELVLTVDETDELITALRAAQQTIA